MKTKRIIARLDVKGPNVVKGIQFECLRVIGRIQETAKEYYEQGADELIYMDTVASLYGRNNLVEIIKQATNDIFIPITVGGGIRSTEDIEQLLQAGAEKVAINTAATKNPELIRESTRLFGSQCIMASIEAKKRGDDKWEAYIDNGRQSTGLDVIEWVKQLEDLGVGEIFVTSVDREGTEKGFDIDLIKKITETVSVPVIASGGAGNIEHILESFTHTHTDAVALGSMLHYHTSSIREIKKELEEASVPVRKDVYADTKKETVTKSVDIVDYNKYTLRQFEENLSMDIPNISEEAETEGRDTEKADVGIINYRINNVKSVAKAFEKIGKTTKIISSPEEMGDARCLVLPGVGAFGQAVKTLEALHFSDEIRKKAVEGVPILGICLGMQLLLTKGEEFGEHPGLNLIPGSVISLEKKPKEADVSYKLPHIGWNTLQIPATRDSAYTWKETILECTDTHNPVYFVHTYCVVVDNNEDCIATAEYGGHEFCVVIEKDNVCGVQFHPEKSGEAGLSILSAFCTKYGI